MAAAGGGGMAEGALLTNNKKSAPKKTLQIDPSQTTRLYSPVHGTMGNTMGNNFRTIYTKKNSRNFYKFPLSPAHPFRQASKGHFYTSKNKAAAMKNLARNPNRPRNNFKKKIKQALESGYSFEELDELYKKYLPQYSEPLLPAPNDMFPGPKQYNLFYKDQNGKIRVRYTNSAAANMASEVHKQEVENRLSQEAQLNIGGPEQKAAFQNMIEKMGLGHMLNEKKGGSRKSKKSKRTRKTKKRNYK